MKIKLSRNREGGFSAGGSPMPPKPPAAPTKDQAAKNILDAGAKRAPVGFDSTILGDNNPLGATGAKKTLLGS